MPWRSTIPPGTRTPERGMRRLLQCRGSLFQALKRRCPGAMRIDVLALHCSRPTLEEALALGLALERRVWIRESLLCCGSKAWVYARTVIPPSSLAGANRSLHKLRKRPLGRILFRATAARRRWLQYGAIDARMLPAATLSSARSPTSACQRRRQTRTLPALAMPSPQVKRLWARRSLFALRHKPLLLTEYFLSGLETREP